MTQTPLAVNDACNEGFPLLTYALESAVSSPQITQISRIFV